ncbi:adenylate cyclase [Paenibacillus sp. CAA11]|uniref:F390 synthetase-related protein n=1 Tax=Paenibacillus sp. CAA11 TaxID=1532905 RepID=UPI000D3CE5D6|nr:F390 synthetase-related protein [Paenibacillus sp. CAA11]AWB45631.1 adenylate cyclase [Paenibacillus sp. CAA11]
MKLGVLLKHYGLAKYRERHWKSREQLEQWQHRRVVSFLKQLKGKSRLYSEYLETLDPEDWREWPTLDKNLMMDRFDDLNTVGVTKEEAFEVALRAERERDFSPQLGSVTVGLSSGTSGNRGIFLVSEEERAAWAGTVLAKALPGSLLAKHRVAFFLRADSNLYQSVKSKRITFRFFDMIRPLEEHIEQLNELLPSILVGPPSMLRLLAEAKRDGRLAAAPERIISVAEVLEELDRRFVENIFGTKLHQIYQCTEGFLAFTCSHGTLHLNEDILVIQKDYLDEAAGLFSPVITDFSRQAQPIVRYRLNDLLTERPEPCPCGCVFTAISSIGGRTDDVFYGRVLGSEEQTAPIFPDFIRRAVMLASPQILEYRIVQHSQTQVEAAIRASVPLEDIQGALETELISAFTSQGCCPPDVRFVPYSFVAGPVKLRRIERRFAKK